MPNISNYVDRRGLSTPTPLASPTRHAAFNPDTSVQILNVDEAAPLESVYIVKFPSEEQSMRGLQATKNWASTPFYFFTLDANTYSQRCDGVQPVCNQCRNRPLRSRAPRDYTPLDVSHSQDTLTQMLETIRRLKERIEKLEHLVGPDPFRVYLNEPYFVSDQSRRTPDSLGSIAAIFDIIVSPIQKNRKLLDAPAIEPS
ncbi:hypothetical protein C8R44DRAFT_869082 [Mycena epipterygia]|nr:hypothetical protein C8R44DRAFT_869082 [Mycena epipterygia]